MTRTHVTLNVPAARRLRMCIYAQLFPMVEIDGEKKKEKYMCRVECRLGPANWLIHTYANEDAARRGYLFAITFWLTRASVLVSGPFWADDDLHFSAGDGGTRLRNMPASWVHARNESKTQIEKLLCGINTLGRTTNCWLLLLVPAGSVGLECDCVLIWIKKSILMMMIALLESSSVMHSSCLRLNGTEIWRFGNGFRAEK